jgi:hypothetical protein
MYLLLIKNAVRLLHSSYPPLPLSLQRLIFCLRFGTNLEISNLAFLLSHE